MEIRLEEIHKFIEIRTAPIDTLEEKFITWFHSELLGTDFSDIIDVDKDFEKLSEWQRSATALADKVRSMVLEMNNGKCNFDSIMRMLCRICDHGVKTIQDGLDPQDTEGGKSGVDSFIISKRKMTFGGFKGKKAHFRWNWTVYTLHEAYINTLIQIIRQMNYFEINPNADMGSLEGREVIVRALPTDKSLLLKK